MQKRLNQVYAGDIVSKFPGGSELYEKDYYKYFPSHSLYLEIKDLVRSITVLERTINKYL